MSLMRNKRCNLSIIIAIIATFTPISISSKIADAAVVGSQIISSDGITNVSREENLNKIRKILENKIVVERLRSSGLSDEELSSKLKSMSEEQIHQLAALSDRIPAGGDGAATAAVIVLVVFVIAIILLIVLRRL